MNALRRQCLTHSNRVETADSQISCNALRFRVVRKRIHNIEFPGIREKDANCPSCRMIGEMRLRDDLHCEIYLTNQFVRSIGMERMTDELMEVMATMQVLTKRHQALYREADLVKYEFDCLRLRAEELRTQPWPEGRCMQWYCSPLWRTLTLLDNPSPAFSRN